MSKTRVLTLIGGALLVTGGIVGGFEIAQAQPATNVSKGKHPNLAAAQNLSLKAYDKIVAAQQANEWDMAGHAAKAKNLLEQANAELKQAAQAANKNK
jgi:hypothetical protein